MGDYAMTIFAAFYAFVGIFFAGLHVWQSIADDAYGRGDNASRARLAIDAVKIVAAWPLMFWRMK